MRTYVSKARVGASEAMKGAVEDAFNNGVSEYEKWKLLVRSTLQRGNVHFKKLFPKVMFLNDTSPECSYRLFHKKEELENYLMIVLIYFKWIC